MENISFDGNIPEGKAQVYICAKGELIVFAHAFNIMVGISLYQKALEHFKDFVIFFVFYMRYKFHVSACYRICKMIK